MNGQKLEGAYCRCGMYDTYHKDMIALDQQVQSMRSAALRLISKEYL
jgi:hypothetical protein